MYEPPQYTKDGWPLLFPDYEVEANECMKCREPSTHHGIDLTKPSGHYTNSRNGCVAQMGDFKPRRVKK